MNRNKILSIHAQEQNLETEIREAAAQYPLTMHADVKEAFKAAEEEDFEKAEQLCCKLLDYKAAPEIRYLLGTCYFLHGHIRSAEMVFGDLVQDYPENMEYHICHGIANHGIGRCEEAVKELGVFYPLKEYRPFYYTSYGDCLQRTGKLKQSREAFLREADVFKETGTIPSAHMMDGAFQNLLYLDLTLGNGKYPEDLRLYYDFLDQVEMTHEMQEKLAGNIVYFGSLMSNKWYHPLFLEFITHIRDRGFLTEPETMETLESAFSSWESYVCHEDRKISSLMESYLVAIHEKNYPGCDRDMLMDEERTRIDTTALTYSWYLCLYAPEHPEELDYIKNTYPYTYTNSEALFEQIQGDAKGTAGKLLEELYPYAHCPSRKEFEESMYTAYKKACGTKKDPVYVYDGTDTYRRGQPKVGRNDPCPCGSGKKYKKCCGR